MIIIINKIDTIPEDKREEKIKKLSQGLTKALSNTKFANAAIVAVAAGEAQIGVDKVLDVLLKNLVVPKRTDTGPFIFAIDHCFPIKGNVVHPFICNILGQGTVMTGTVLSGKVSVNQTIEIPALKIEKKVKSMQMFHKPVNSAMQVSVVMTTNK